MQSNKTILVTGGTGFIGSNIVDYLIKNTIGSNIYVLDRTIKQDNVFVNVQYIKGCIEDETIYEQFSNVNFDYVFHQAAIVDTTYDNDDIYDINCKSLQYLYNLCLKSGATLVYASSAATYGNSPSPNIVGIGENPLNKYGRSKLDMDMFARELIKENKIKIVGLRYFNVYGPREKHKGSMASMVYKIYCNIKNNTATNLLKWGEQCRDFIYVKDIVKGNICAAVSNKSGIYNLGTGISRTFSDMIKILSLTTDSAHLKITYIDNPYTFFQTYTQANIDNTIKDINYTPDFTFESGICDYVKYLQN